MANALYYNMNIRSEHTRTHKTEKKKNVVTDFVSCIANR